MSAKKDSYTVVGTTVDAKGNRKMRWANDYISRVKNLSKAEHTEINLIELPSEMTKLEAAEYFLANGNLTDADKAVVEAKIAEKSKSEKAAGVKATLTGNASQVDEKAPATDAGFVDNSKVDA